MNISISSISIHLLTLLTVFLASPSALPQASTEDRIRELRIRQVMDVGRLLQESLRSAQSRGDLNAVVTITDKLKEAETIYRNLIANESPNPAPSSQTDTAAKMDEVLNGKLWQVRDDSSGNLLEFQYKDSRWLRRTSSNGDFESLQTDFIWMGLFRVKDLSANREFFFVLNNESKELRIYSAVGIYEGSLIEEGKS